MATRIQTQIEDHGPRLKKLSEFFDSVTPDSAGNYVAMLNTDADNRVRLNRLKTDLQFLMMIDDGSHSATKYVRGEIARMIMQHPDLAEP